MQVLTVVRGDGGLGRCVDLGNSAEGSGEQQGEMSFR